MLDEVFFFAILPWCRRTSDLPGIVLTNRVCRLTRGEVGYKHRVGTKRVSSISVPEAARVTRGHRNRTDMPGARCRVFYCSRLRLQNRFRAPPGAETFRSETVERNDGLWQLKEVGIALCEFQGSHSVINRKFLLEKVAQCGKANFPARAISWSLSFPKNLKSSTRQTRKTRDEGLARPFILFLSGPDFSRDVLGKFYG